MRNKGPSIGPWGTPIEYSNFWDGWQFVIVVFSFHLTKHCTWYICQIIFQLVRWIIAYAKRSFCSNAWWLTVSKVELRSTNKIPANLPLLMLRNHFSILKKTSTSMFFNTFAYGRYKKKLDDYCWVKLFTHI